MADIGRTLSFYKKRFKDKEHTFNRPSKLPDYFGKMIGNKKEVVIAELGAGAVNTIGNYWPDVEVKIVASDIYANEYAKLWGDKIPIVNVEYQDMENLTYPDEMFDIVHCKNALDHTENPYKAISEMKRVCKKGGWIYLSHARGQKHYGGMHRHNFEELDLPDFKCEEQIVCKIQI